MATPTPDEPVEEFKKTRDGTYGMAIIRFILLLLIPYNPGFVDNFMSLVYYITMDTLASMVNWPVLYYL